LAIGKRLGEMGTTGGVPEGEASPQAQVFDGSTIATLELSPTQSEIIINSAAIGRLSLVLRSIVDFAPNATMAERDLKSNQTIRVIRFGKEGTISAASSAGSEPVPVVDPAAYMPPAAAPAAPPLQVQLQ
jgi:pilus assembly protein CpaB